MGSIKNCVCHYKMEFIHHFCKEMADLKDSGVIWPESNTNAKNAFLKSKK